MQEEKVHELIRETEKVINKLIGNLVVSITEHEKYRAELISLLGQEEESEIGSLERSYFYSGPPKVLYINIPSLPVSFNRSMRGSFIRDKHVYSSLIEWWDIKVKNACGNMQLIDEEFPLETFTKAIAVVKFTFCADILRDVDNFAVKCIIDSLEKNKIIADDNKEILQSIMPIFATGKKQGIEIFLTDDEELLEMIHHFYDKYKGTFERLEKIKENPQPPDEFFDLKNA